MNDPLLALERVGFSHEGGRVVLRDCDLAIRGGERLGLVGANGSGKTTLLYLLVGLLRPTTGRVLALGSERRREADFHDVRRHAGLLFQDSDDQLFCATVAEDVAFGPLNLGLTQDAARQVVRETLQQVGLAGYESRITYRLSGGEKRLVALATVLAMQPDVLLLDEPTAGLDEPSCARVTELLASLPQAMLIVSHDRTFLETISHRTLHLRDGMLAEHRGA